MTSSVVGAKNILIVEDEAAILRFLSLLLEEYGNIDTACNGKEALAKVSRRHFDAIVSDVRMPVMDGIEFYRAAIKRIPELKDRFLFYTNSNSKDHVKFFRKYKLTVLEKFSDVKDIENALNKILEMTEAEADMTNMKTTS